MAEEDVLYEEENSLRAILSGGTLADAGKRRIKAATLPKLIDLITDKQMPAETAQVPFERMLVESYTLFCSSSFFVDTLIAKFERIKDDEEQARAKHITLGLLRTLLGELLHNNPESHNVEKIRRFAIAQESHLASSMIVAITMARSKEAPKSQAIWTSLEEPDPPILRLPPDAEVTKLDDVEPRELAKQLTLLMEKNFAQLRPREYTYFLRKKTSLFDLIYNHMLWDERVIRKMGNLTNIITYFCGLVHWLRHEIDECSYQRKPVTLTYLFHFAKELYRIRNLHALAAVVLVLSPHFGDLQQILSPSEVGELTELAQLFHCSESETLEGNFEFSHSTKRGRDLLYRTYSACLPFMGTYLHAMQIINATEAAFDDDQLAFVKTKSMFNVQKMERLSLVRRLLQQFQNRRYGYDNVTNIHCYLKQRIEQGLRAMQLRRLGHLCREAVWRHKVDWRRDRLPAELTEFLSQHQVRLGDVLSVLSSL